MLMHSFSRSQMNATSTSSSSGFSFGTITLRQPKDAMMVVLDDDGLSVVRCNNIDKMEKCTCKAAAPCS